MAAVWDARSASVDALPVEVAGYLHMLELLRTEQEALRVADAQALAEIAQAKLAQVLVLQDLGAARTNALRNEVCGTTAAGMHALLERCAQPERARKHWDHLLRLAADAQRHNTLNARLASVQQRHVDRALTALHHGGGSDSTYDADGRSRYYAAPRTFAAI